MARSLPRASLVRLFVFCECVLCCVSVVVIASSFERVEITPEKEERVRPVYFLRNRKFVVDLVVVDLLFLFLFALADSYVKSCSSS